MPLQLVDEASLHETLACHTPCAPAEVQGCVQVLPGTCLETSQQQRVNFACPWSVQCAETQLWLLRVQIHDYYAQHWVLSIASVGTAKS